MFCGPCTSSPQQLRLLACHMLFKANAQTPEPRSIAPRGFRRCSRSLTSFGQKAEGCSRSMRPCSCGRPGILLGLSSTRTQAEVVKDMERVRADKEKLEVSPSVKMLVGVAWDVLALAHIACWEADSAAEKRAREEASRAVTRTATGSFALSETSCSFSCVTPGVRGRAEACRSLARRGETSGGQSEA